MNAILIRSFIRCHSRMSGILLKRDSGQAGMTDNLTMPVYSLVIPILLMLLLPVVAHSGDGNVSKDAERSLSVTCEKGLFSVDLRVRDHELRVGENSLDLVVRGEKGATVAGADLAITPWMPDMGHGVPDKAAITDKGGGNYLAENVVLNMGGLWELKIKVRKDRAEDLCVFTFRKVKSAGSRRTE